MVVAIQTWDLHLPNCHSLKEKRGVLKPLTSGLRRTLNVSVAETGHQDLWQRARIAVVSVNTDHAHLESTLHSVAGEAGNARDALLVDSNLEIL